MKFLLRHSALMFALLALQRSAAIRKIRNASNQSSDLILLIFTLKLEPKQVPQAGKTFKVRIHVQPGSVWHVYAADMSNEGGAIPLELTIPDSISDYFQIEGFTETGREKTWYDSSLQSVVKAHFSPYDVIATIKVRKNAPNPLPFSLFVHFHTCNEASICMPPRWFKVPMDWRGQPPLQLKIANGVPDTSSPVLAHLEYSNVRSDSSTRMGQAAGGGSSQPPAAPSKQAAVSSGDVTAIAHESIWQFILAAAGFGLLALLTPCVFPMVPITVSFFTKRNAGSKKEATKDAFLYAGGIIVTFVLLGFMLSLIAGLQVLTSLRPIRGLILLSLRSS